MNTNRAKGVAMSVVALMLMAQPAAAGPVINIMGRVATVCRVSLAGGSPVVANNGERDLGRLTELCNNVDGYRLVLLHPAGLEDAAVMVDGERIPISPDSTRTIIVDSNHADYRDRNLTLLVADNSLSVPINIEAQPKGLIF